MATANEQKFNERLIYVIKKIIDLSVLASDRRITYQVDLDSHVNSPSPSDEMAALDELENLKVIKILDRDVMGKKIRLFYLRPIEPRFTELCLKSLNMHDRGINPKTELFSKLTFELQAGVLEFGSIVHKFHRG